MKADKILLEKLDYIHCALCLLYIQECMNKNDDMLFEALGYIEDIREKELNKLGE